MANEAKTKLSRADMEKVISKGGSVLHGGQIYTSAGSLPDEIDLATTDEETAAAAANIEEEEKALAAKKEKVAAKTSTSTKKR